VTFTRARNAEQKDTRREHVLATARSLLKSGTSVHDLGLNELARSANMTKSNLYRYFESREQVLLLLLRDEWVAWFEQMASTWPMKNPATLRTLCEHLAQTLAAQPLLCDLTSALPTVLERNLSEAAIAEFKDHLLAFYEHAATFIADKVPGLSRTTCARLLNDGAALIGGLWPYAHPAPAVKNVLASEPRFRLFQRDFATDLARMFHAIAADLVV
jgi:AcrR family transcriptional regulator